jgi:hypothetical protein
MEEDHAARDEDTAIGRMYLRLHQIDHDEDPDVLLHEVLDAIVTEAKAELGYVELRSVDSHGHTSRFASAVGCDLEVIKSKLSTTILEQVIARGETFAGSAVSDAAFADLASVKRNAIEQVLVVAVGDGYSPRGAVYVQARRGSSFPHSARLRVELLARRLCAPLAWRLLGEEPLWREMTIALQRRELIAALGRCQNNRSALARELGLSRRRIYQLLEELQISKPR